MTPLCYFKEQLAEHSYAPTTATNYCKHVLPFIEHFKEAIDKVPQEAIQHYVDQASQQYRWSFSTRKQCICALRLFYGLLYQRKIKISSKPNQRQAAAPPFIFSPAQVEQLFAAAKNSKHQSILMTIYSGGLRVSELTRLRLVDVDKKTMQLHITDTAGNRIRKIPLSERLWEVLQLYCTAYRPTYWLFEGHFEKAYSTRNIQNIFCETLLAAQLPSKATLSSLRHSFAVHLLQQGVGIQQVNQLLGHQSLVTTQKYLRLLNHNSSKVINPLDQLLS